MIGNMDVGEGVLPREEEEREEREEEGRGGRKGEEWDNCYLANIA